MKILNHFQHLTLTNDQRDALEKLSAFLQSDDRVFILQGYAGSGKTTLLKGFVEYLKSLKKDYQLMAPTGRAAKVINQKTGFEATTVHKGIYSFDELEEIEQSDDKNDVSFLYQYKLRNNIEVHDSVLLVDEASMVSDILSQGEFFRFGSGYLLRDLITYSRIQEAGTTSKIIFIGDPAQLPPIGMNNSPALHQTYIQAIYQLRAEVAEMKEVKRQDADNGILLAATKIRQSLTSGFFNDFNLVENKKDIFNPLYQDYLETYKAQMEQKIIICYKNKTALELNKRIRIDKFGNNLPIQTSDTVIIGTNNYNLGVMNGEFAIVSETSTSVESREVRFRLKEDKTEAVRLIWRQVTIILPDDNGQTKTVSGYILENYLYGDNYLKPQEQKALYVDFKNRHPKLKKGTEEFKEAISTDKYFNAIQLKYGYAVTCHKAQGGEWPNAFVFWDRGVASNFNFLEGQHNISGKTNSDFYRWAYTAVTRSSKKLYAINPPFFSSFSGMTFVDINVLEAFKELTGETSEVVELELEGELIDILKKFELQDAPLTIQNHFVQRWYQLKKYYIEIVGYRKVGYEIWYTFQRENNKTGFKYWINKNNVFRPTFQKLSAITNSDELFDSVSEILAHPQELLINRNTPESIIAKISFDITLEEEKPFLKSLFDGISSHLNAAEVISEIIHIEYRERYIFERGGEQCVIDFEYNKHGFFGRVLPLKNKCNSSTLMERIKEIVHNLKNTSYAI
jgi:hypothetical protein